MQSAARTAAAAAGRPKGGPARVGRRARGGGAVGDETPAAPPGRGPGGWAAAAVGAPLNGGTCGCGYAWSPSGQCAISNCTPQTCAQLGAQCGTPSDGCGATLNCGGCEGGTCSPSGQCSSSTTTCNSLVVSAPAVA